MRKLLQLIWSYILLGLLVIGGICLVALLYWLDHLRFNI